MKEFSILLFLSLIVSLFAKNPRINDQNFPPFKNDTYDSDQYSNSYNHYYNDYYNGYSMNASCSGSLLLAGALFSLWTALLILYFIVNRKKNTFTVLVNSQSNLSGYMNV